MRVFLSSNHAEIESERDLVRSVVRSFDHELVESPSEGASWERVSELIAGSDALVLLLGRSLGSVKSPGDRPGIVSEYALAKELGKPTHALIFGDDFLAVDSERSLAEENEPERRRWKEFRSQLESELYADIEQPGDIEHVLGIVLGEMEAEVRYGRNPTFGSTEKLEEGVGFAKINDVQVSADADRNESLGVDGPIFPTDPPDELVTIYAGDQVDADDIADLLLVISKAFEAIGGEPLVVREGGSGRFRSTVTV